MSEPIDLDPIFALPIPERIGIVQIILDSIATEVAPPPLSEKYKAELNRRVAEYRANPKASKPWEVVREELKRSRE